MSYHFNNEQNLNDVIFANRNKSYGAYAIRSAYGNTVFKSLFIMTVGFGTIMSLAYYFCNRNNNDPGEKVNPFYKDSVIVVPFDNTIKENKKNDAVAATDPVSGKKTPAENNFHFVDTLTTSTHSVETEPGNATTGTGTTSAAIPSGGGGSTAGTNTTTEMGSGTGIVESYGVDTQPEFEGGLNALYKFLSKNVRYPSIASEQGKQGTVYVKFVVDEKGKVGSLTLQNNAGYGLDEEALRVVNSIPDFKKPATIKGHPVKVYYQLPIKFKLN